MDKNIITIHKTVPELAKAREKGTPLEEEDLEKLYAETGKRALSEAVKSGFTWKPLV